MPLIGGANISTDGRGTVAFNSVDASFLGLGGQTSQAVNTGGKASSPTTINGVNLGNELGEGVFAGANGTNQIEISFRSLVAGSGVSLVGDGNTITINSLRGGSTFIGLTDVPQAIVPNGVLFGNQAANALAFVPGPLAANQVLTWTGTALAWRTPTPLGVTGVGLIGGAGITINGPSPITTSGTFTASLAPTPVTPAVYTNPTITVDQFGRITAAANGSGGSGAGSVTSVGLTAASSKISVTGTSPITGAGSFIVDVVESALSLNNQGGTLSVAKGGTGTSNLTAGALLVGSGTSPIGVTPVPSADQYLTWNGSAFEWAAIPTVGNGTVSSIGLQSTGGTINITGTSPITSIGTFSVDVNQANLTLNSIGGVLGVGKGGTGAVTLTAGGLVIGNGTSPLTATPAPSATGQVLSWNGSNFIWQAPTNGGTVTSVAATGSSNITVSGSPIISSGTLAFDLATTSVAPGIYTNANITVDAFGRITAAVSGPASGGSVTNVATGTGLTGGPITNTGTISLADTNVTPGNYTNSSITVDAQGRITAASNGTGVGTVTSIGLTAGSTKISIAGSPITTSGSITVDVNQANLSLNAIGGGPLAVTSGGTGLATLPVNTVLLGNGTSAIASSPVPTSASQVLTWTGSAIAWTFSGGVTSITVDGTVNEISSTGSPITSSGTITLGLPTALTFTGKTVTNGTFNSIALSGTTTTPTDVPLVVALPTGTSVGPAISVTAGAGGAGSAGGALSLTSGAGDSAGAGGDGGAINITAGAAGGSFASHTGGAVSIQAGSSTLSNPGAAITIKGGDGGASGGGGGVLIQGGNSGSSGSQFAGGITLQGGTAAGGNMKGSNIVLSTGAATGSGTQGNISMEIASRTQFQVIDTSGTITGNLAVTGGTSTVAGNAAAATLSSSAGDIRLAPPTNQDINLAVSGTGALRFAGTAFLTTMSGASNTTFLRGDGTWAIPAAVSSVGLTSSDITVGGASPITSTGTFTLTLPSVNTSGTGTFTSVTVDSKGRVTAGSNPGFLTSNQNVTLSGDITGSGTTAITTTLANVASNTGTFTNSTITVDAKGRVTAAANGAGGSGSTTLAGDTDVSIASPTDGQVLTYNTSAAKWINQAVATGGLTPFSFVINYSGGNVTSISNLPTGWSGVVNSTSSFTITHNLTAGRLPNGPLTQYALNVTTLSGYVQKVVAGNVGSQYAVVFSNTASTFQVTNATTGNTGVDPNSSITYRVIF